MSNETLLTLAGAFAAALVVNAALLWLTCRWLNVRHSATPERRGVTFRRALTLAACGLAATLLAGAACWTLSIDALLALNAHAALSLAASVLILRYGLPVGWGKALGVEVVWTAISVPAAIVGVVLALSSTIATGMEMADVIRGPHREVACPQCGYAFAIGAKEDGVEMESCTCPNCRLSIAFAPPDVPAPPGFVTEPEAKPPDRVLSPGPVFRLAKSAPERFDVVAVERVVLVGQPGVRLEPPAFLRVVGLPGEVVAIYRGDFYVLDAEPRDPDAFRFDLELPGGIERKAREPFWEQARIVRKPPTKVLAMMRLVYDSQHSAADLTRPEEQRWAEDAGSGWRKDGTGFRHDGNAAQDGWLRYRHVLRPHGFAPSLITDFEQINVAENWVGDLILECDVEAGPSGEWALELSRGPDRFQARFDLTARTRTLLRLAKGKSAETLATARVKMPATARVRFANVDERLVVWVNDRLLFGEGVPYAGPRELLPERANDLDRPASVAAKGAALRVRRLRLLRDVYFVDDARDERMPGIGGWGRGRLRKEPFEPANPATWRQSPPPPPNRLDAEYYCLLGDNRAAPGVWQGATWRRESISGRGLLRYFPPSRVGRLE